MAIFNRLRARLKWRKTKIEPPVNVDGLVLSLPTTWKDATLKQYCTYWSSVSDEIRIAALAGVDRKVIRKLPVQTIDTLAELCAQIMHEDPNDRLNVPTPILTIRGTDFGYLPDLSKVSGGEWGDLMVYAAQDNFFKNVHKLFAIIYRPINKRLGDKYSIEVYDSEKHQVNADLFLDQKMLTIGGGLGFFTNLLPHLSESGLQYSETMIQSLTQELTEMKARNS